MSAIKTTSNLARAALALTALLMGCDPGTWDLGGSGKGRGKGRGPISVEQSDTIGEDLRVSSPAALQIERDTLVRLEPAVTGIRGGRVLFVDCNQEPCSTRVQAGSLADLKDVLFAVSSENQGRINYVARSITDPYTGRSFHADVVLGTDDIRAVPTDENELLVNNPGANDPEPDPEP